MLLTLKDPATTHITFIHSKGHDLAAKDIQKRTTCGILKLGGLTTNQREEKNNGRSYSIP